MRHLYLAALCVIILLSSSQCDKEIVPLNGHLKLTITYPEAVLENDSFYYIQVPGVGASARLYDKDAICLGYKDAMLNLVRIDDHYATSEYKLLSNEKGKVLFRDIPAGKYFLIVYVRQRSTYTEKYIELNGGDTLKLSKVFSPNASFVEDLEPWDYVMPVN